MDRIFEGFLRRQQQEAEALVNESDLVRILPVGGSPPDRWLIRLSCRGLVRQATGEIVEHDRFEAGVWFPPDYLSEPEPNPFEVVTWLWPPNLMHPNSGIGPGGHRVVCVGHIASAMPLTDLVEQIFEIVTYRKVTMVESDALDRDACVWTRRNQHRLPIDRRTLRRRAIEVEVEPPGSVRPA